MKNRKGSHLKVTAALAMLVAISIILGKYLAIRGGDILRFSFENLPIIFAGVAFGPLAGALVGVVADLVGCVLVGYAINPLVTAGAFAIGITSGLVSMLSEKSGINKTLRIALSVAISHIIGSVLIKSVGLSAFYDLPLYALMLWRLLNYVIVGALECVILVILFKNKMITSTLRSFKEPKKAAMDEKETKTDSEGN